MTLIACSAFSQASCCNRSRTDGTAQTRTNGMNGKGSPRVHLRGGIKINCLDFSIHFDIHFEDVFKNGRSELTQLSVLYLFSKHVSRWIQIIQCHKLFEYAASICPYRNKQLMISHKRIRSMQTLVPFHYGVGIQNCVVIILRNCRQLFSKADVNVPTKAHDFLWVHLTGCPAG